MKIKPILLLFLVSCFLFLRPAPANAAGKEFLFNENSTWELKADSTIQVSTSIKVINKTSNYYSTGYAFWLPADQITDPKANYDDGTSISIKQTDDTQTVNGLTYTYKKLDLSFPKEVIGLGQSFNVNIRYLMSGALEQKGQTYELTLPNFSGDSEITKTVAVKAPKNFGTAHFLTDDPAKSHSDSAFNYYTYSDTSLSNKQQILVFGDQMSRRLDYNYPLENRDILPSFFKLFLPMESDRQKVFIKSINPVPYYKGQTADGKNFVYYFLMPGQKINIEAKVDVLTRGETTSFDKTGMIADVPADLKTYTNPTQYWQTNDPLVLAKASELIKPNDSVFTNSERVYNHVISIFNYNQEKIDKNVRLGAVEALKQPDNVVCQEYADAFITILRSGGIPAREYYGMTDNAELKTSEKNILHAWAEVYIPKFGWLVADPTWGEAGIKFGKMAFDHLAVDTDTGSDLTNAIVTKNGQDYDLGMIYTENVKLSDITETASGQALPKADLGKIKIYDNNRTYLLEALAVLIVVLAVIISIVRRVRRKRAQINV